LELRSRGEKKEWREKEIPQKKNVRSQLTKRGRDYGEKEQGEK